MMLGIGPSAGVSQSQTANSSIIQSAKLLHYTREELEAFILEQYRRNPLIEVENLREPGSDAAALAPVGESAAKLEPRPGPTGSKQSVGSGSKSSSADGISHWEDLIAQRMTLREHLHAQIGAGFRDPADRAIACHIIESIDDDGYVRSSTELISVELDVPVARVEKALSQIQQMDPTGVGARNLAECLRLQLQDTGALTPAFEVLLAHLHLLAVHKHRELAGLCGVTIDCIREMAQLARSLNPRPGSIFSTSPMIVAVPDVYVEFAEDGTVLTSLNDQALPRVLVNRQYFSEIRRKCSNTRDVKFVTDCMRDANMLVRGLDQRAQTILKVATEVVLRQEGFLLHGVEHLKPLILRDVADKIGVHLSTVSRAIANRYIMTPLGMFELKYFFTNAISAEGDSDVMAASVVRHRIRQMIQDEPADAILSDDAIIGRLAAGGIRLARRTVAKYRESMNIPHSHQRRRIRGAELLAG